MKILSWRIILYLLPIIHAYIDKFASVHSVVESTTCSRTWVFQNETPAAENANDVSVSTYIIRSNARLILLATIIASGIRVYLRKSLTN